MGLSGYLMGSVEPQRRLQKDKIQHFSLFVLRNFITGVVKVKSLCLPWVVHLLLLVTSLYSLFSPCALPPFQLLMSLTALEKRQFTELLQSVAVVLMLVSSVNLRVRLAKTTSERTAMIGF